MKNGFTLVELSIVLVIIGLLIGGLLVARSMISTVEVQNIVSNTQKLEILTNNFISTYKQLPGDSSLFAAPGNNDGELGIGTLTCNPDPISDGESYQYYSHLSQAGMTDRPYKIYEPNVCSGGTDHSPWQGASVTLWEPFYVKLEHPMARALYEGAVWPFLPMKSVSIGTLRFYMRVNPLQGEAMARKMGSVPNSSAAVGFVLRTPGVCYDELDDSKDCTDPAAVYDDVYYALPY